MLQSALLDSSAAARHGRHLLQKCYKDWFDLVPRRIVCEYARTSHYEDDDPSMPVLDPVRDRNNCKKTETPPPDSYYAQLLSPVGAFDRFILPACRDLDISLSSYGDMTASVPMAISLWDFHQTASREDGASVWKRNDVRVALNPVHDGLGDKFTDEDRGDARVSQFGAHWDSITSKAATSDGTAPPGWYVGVQCNLCINTAVGLERVEEMARFMDDPYYYTEKRRKNYRSRAPVS